MSKAAIELVVLFLIGCVIATLALLGVYGGYLKNMTIFGAGFVLTLSPFLTNTGRLSEPSNRHVKFGLTFGAVLFIVSFCVGPINIGSLVLR